LNKQELLDKIWEYEEAIIFTKSYIDNKNHAFYTESLVSVEKYKSEIYQLKQQLIQINNAKH